jgi:hypothetical protein
LPEQFEMQLKLRGRNTMEQDRTRKYRFTALLLAVAMLAELLPAMALHTWASTPTSYVNKNGGTGSAAAVYVTSSADTVNWTAEWYAVSGNVTITGHIIVAGAVNLILADGATLTAAKGITVRGTGNSLTIYAQQGGTGALVAKGDYQHAGIGGSSTDPNAGTIVLYGGKITASGGEGAAGIGGGSGGGSGTIQIYGGQVTATGSDGGAGIGGGSNGAGETIEIYGGRVTATGGETSNGYDGAGIGGGSYKSGGNILINGGYVTATSGNSGDGIGSGYSTVGQNNFSTGTNGGAVIVTNSITDTSKQNSWSGVIFQNGTGTVYGDEVELNADAEIPASTVLTVPAGKKLVIPSGVTLTCNGTVKNNGKIENNGTFHLNNAQKPGDLGNLTGSGEVITADGTRYRYSDGWSAVEADGGSTLLALLVCGGLFVWTAVSLYYFYDPATQAAAAA